MIEHMHLLEAGIAELVVEASVPDPLHPVLVLGTAPPAGAEPDSFVKLISRVRSRVEVVDVPKLPAAELITLLRQYAPATEHQTAMRVVARLGGPLHLTLWLTSREVRQYLEDHDGAIELDSIALPESASDVLRLRWDEQSEPLQRVLAVAATMSPLRGDNRIHFVPGLLEKVCEEVFAEERMPGQVCGSITAAVDPDEWVQTDGDLAFFRTSLFARAARGEAERVLGAAGIAQVREVTQRYVEAWIEQHHDEYTLPETNEASLIARWAVAFQTRVTPAPPGERVAIPQTTGALAAAQWRLASDAATRADYADAVRRGEVAVASLERVLGPAHPVEYVRAHETIPPEWGMKLVIAEWLVAENKSSAAIEKLRGLLADLERHAGTSHLATLTVRSSLAAQLRDAGIDEESIGQFQTVVADFTRVVGPLAPETLDARGGLAEAFGLAQQYDAAVTELRALIPLFIEVYGEDHPDTFTVRGALAAFLNEAGQPRAAGEQTRLLLEDQERVLGADSPQTLTTRNNLAVMLFDAGEAAEAAAQFERLAEARAAVLGSTNVDTLEARMNLAAALLESGAAQAAVREFQAALDVMSQTLAPDNPRVLRSRGRLANAVGHAGDARRAADEFRALERASGYAREMYVGEVAAFAEAAEFWEREANS